MCYGHATSNKHFVDLANAQAYNVRCVLGSAGPKGRPRGATAESPSGGGAQAQVYKPSGPIVH